MSRNDLVMKSFNFKLARPIRQLQTACTGMEYGFSTPGTATLLEGSIHSSGTSCQEATINQRQCSKGGPIDPSGLLANISRQKLAAGSLRFWLWHCFLTISNNQNGLVLGCVSRETRPVKASNSSSMKECNNINFLTSEFCFGGLVDYVTIFLQDPDPSNLAAAPGATAAAQLAASEGLELMQTSHPVQTCSNMFKLVHISSYFSVLSYFLLHISTIGPSHGRHKPSLILPTRPTRPTQPRLPIRHHAAS